MMSENRLILRSSIEGYIKRQMQQVAQFKKLEDKKLPEEFDYSEVNSLRREAVQLNKVQPATIGQASRISGVSPAADIRSAGAFYKKTVRGSDMTDTFRQQMDRELGLLGIKLSEKQLEQFFTYYEMLVEKNKVMNLTAITDETDVVSKHFSDSLSTV